MATDRSNKTRALAKKAADFVMLAHSYRPDKHVIGTTKKSTQVDITDWEVYEKIDGVRAVFKNGKFYSRYGNQFYAPKEFIDLINVDDRVLDGELVHPKGFQNTVSIVRDQSKKASIEFWKDIVYIVFDYITKESISFTVRFEDLNQELHINDNVKLLGSLGKVRSDRTIPSLLKKVETKGGEGLILRNPYGHYITGRSWDLLKVKSFTDVEAIVKDHIKGEGKHKDRLGKLVCELPNGIQFECGTGFTDEEREDPPKIGSLVTIKYFELTDDGKPRFPVYVTNRNYE